MMRYHANPGAVAAPGAEWAARLPAALADVRAAVVAAAPTLGGSATVYTGAAGVAFALARAARGDAALLPLAAQQAAAAAAAPALRRRPPGSVLDGQAGVALVECLVARRAGRARGDAAAAAAPGGPLPRFAAACAAAGAPDQEGSDEILYGRSGTLLGALTLNKELGRQAVGADAIAAICREILRSGRSSSPTLGLAARGGPPLFYTWPEPGGRGDPYLGAAHGLVGIVNALLHCWELLPSVDTAAQGDVLATLDYALSLETSLPGRRAGGHWPVMCRLGGGGEVVHWCHGAPGVAMVAAKAFEVTGSPRYLEAATSAGELVWERGLLTKGAADLPIAIPSPPLPSAGPGLCHGVSGNAYALLSVWRATRDASWRARAERFAAFVAERPSGRGDWGAPGAPFSLFEGLGGALCLLADLLVDAEGARFPFFEV
ncbi:MAG: hypothetical protein J3K34DRAFT_496464 [Monoraphidium minutum]|nr:MAG: hypothetical protein J3K34DRAFT_496464 [Monoraphidium minutum]